MHSQEKIEGDERNKKKWMKRDQKVKEISDGGKNF